MGPSNFFPHLFLSTFCVSFCPIISDLTIPQENSINAECCFLKTQGITTSLKKKHGQFRGASRNNKVCSFELFQLTLASDYRNQCLVRALDKTALEVLDSAGTVHF